MIKFKYLFLLFSVFLFACKKQQPAESEIAKTVSLEIKGYVMTDTLEFLINNKVIGQAIDNQFNIPGKLFNTDATIAVRTKAEKKEVGSFKVDANPFTQIRKIFYDGKTLADNIVLTPVTNPNNMGFRLRFSTTFKGFYGGPVDIEFFEMARTTTRPRITKYTSVKLVNNITASFGDFVELPTIAEEEGWVKSYSFMVYKSGTKELPYKDNTDVNISDPLANYGSFADVFTAGASGLISISPTMQDGTAIGDSYDIADFSYEFR